MKRPASVVAAVVVFSLFLGCDLISLLAVLWRSNGMSIILAALLLPILHALGLFALLLRARWARVYSIVVLSLCAIALAVMGVLTTLQTNNLFNVVPTTLMASFLGWLIYALTTGQEPKRYFATASSRPVPAARQNEGLR